MAAGPAGPQPQPPAPQSLADETRQSGADRQPGRTVRVREVSR